MKKLSKIYMLVGALLLCGLFVVPIWNITLEAPQYPDSIGMDIHINKFKGTGENDIKNINIMNHYVGMKEIPDQIPEFAIFPYFVGGIIVLGVLFAFIGKRSLYITWFVLVVVLGSIAMYDFYQWEYDYGHNLKENAAIKFTDEHGQPMSYQPPLIGAKTILNFRAISMPRIGTFLLVLGMALSVFAFFRARKEVFPKALLLLCLLPLFSCEVKEQPIAYGEEVCVFCNMTIVDRQHASQLVTETGKAYKYDAIECMLNDLKEWDRPVVAFYLVADYANPGKLTDASEAHFLISEKLPSPMGANLTAFAEERARSEIHQKAGGTTLQWKELRRRFELRELAKQ